MTITIPKTAEQFRQLVAALFEPDDLVEARRIRRREDPPRSMFHTAGNFPAVIENLLTESRQGWTPYFGVNPRKRRGGKKAESVSLARCLFVDFDHCSVGEATDRLKDSKLPEPTLTIESGHGLHCYWRLVEPMTDLLQWTRIQKAMIRLLGTDSVVHDPPRIMRLPGFLNVKEEPHVPCKILHCDPGRRCSINDIMAVIELEDLPVEPDKGVTERAECDDSVRSVDSAPLCPTLSHSVHSVSSEVQSLIRSTLPTKPGERRHRIWRFARGLKFNCGLDGPVSSLKPLVREWYKQALPNITTTDFDETWDDFKGAFKDARHGLTNLLENAMRSVDLNDLPAVALKYDSTSTRLLVGLMFALSKLDPGGRFFLSSHEVAARIPDFSPMSAWRRLRTLEDDRVIERLDAGGEYKAARFRWIGGTGDDDRHNESQSAE